MNIIETIADAIKDEYKGAAEYKKLSKKLNRKFAKEVRKMSRDELGHADNLIKIYDYLRFGKLKKVI
jgi:rubrerythrin